MNKHLTLVPEQRKELESDLTQESFLKDFEKILPIRLVFSLKLRYLLFFLYIYSLTQSLRSNSVWMKLWTSVGLL